MREIKVVYLGEMQTYDALYGANGWDLIAQMTGRGWWREYELRDAAGIRINEQLPLSYSIGPGETAYLSKPVGCGG